MPLARKTVRKVKISEPLSPVFCEELVARITKYEATAEFYENRAAELREEADAHQTIADAGRARAIELKALLRASEAAPGGTKWLL